MIAQYQITLTENKNLVLARVTETGCYQVAKFFSDELEVALQLVRDMENMADVYDFTTKGFRELHVI